jgi:hypothetical protein
MELIQQLREEYENAIEYKQGRIDDWKKNEDLYLGKTKKSLRGRVNIPLPIMSGFVDTLLSKIDEPPNLNFEPVKEADYKPAKKIQAMYEHDRTGVSAVDEADWHSKDIDNKKINILYGRSIFKTRGISKPEYRFDLFVTDPYDFYIDPAGGGYVEDALYLGEDGIFKSKSDLETMAKSGQYDTEAVKKIMLGVKDSVDRDDRYANKASRYAALDLSIDLTEHFSEGAVRLIESGTTYQGERHYCLWSYDYNTVLVSKPLKEVFKSNLWWWTSWASFRDKYNFWSKAPADDIRPIAEAMRVLINQELENRQKHNWGMRAYDPSMFPNPEELFYRPDGLVSVNPEEAKIRSIANGLYEFKINGLNGTIDLVNWLDDFMGKKSGVTAATQGSAEDDKVGIYYGNLQQVADRMGLLNKSYASCWRAIGRRYIWALKEHLPAKTAVRIMGSKGVEWTDLSKEEIDPNIDIRVKDTSAELQANEIKKRQQAEALNALQANPNLANQLNPKWVIEKTLSNAGYDDDEIRVATDVERYGNRELLAEAAEAIDLIINKKQPKLNYGANTAYQEKILDYARNNTDNDFDLFQRLVAFSDAHNQIVMDNMSRKLSREGITLNQPEQMEQPVEQPMAMAQPMTDEPIPNTMAGTASRSQQL